MAYDIKKITETAGGCGRLTEIRCYDSIDSTNQEARRIAASGCGGDILVLAENQTCGRGRLGRSWSCAGDDAIAMSLLLRPEIEADRVSMLTIIAAMAVSDGIRRATGLATSIKWPNDLKACGKKLCGILSESVFSGSDFYSVIGIGINVNNRSFPEELSGIAGSVSEFTGKAEERESIIRESISRFYELYDILRRDGDLGSIMHEYNARCITGGGINKYGELIMAD